MIIYTIVSCMFLMLSCQKEGDSKSPVKIIWKKLLHLDNTTSSTVEPVLLENGILFSSTTLDADFRGYFLLDKKSGETIWNWKDNINTLEVHNGHDNIVAYDNKIVVNINNLRYSINQKDGSTIWKSKDGFNYGINVQANHDTIFSVQLTPTDGVLGYYTFEDPTFHTIYVNSLDSANMREAPYPPTSTYVNGDKWLVFYDGFLNYNTAKGHPWLACYNLTADSMIWRRQISEPWFHALVTDFPIIHNNRIYIGESFHVLCLDLFTGNEIWRKTYGNAVAYTPIEIFENKLFVLCEDLFMDVFDLENGARLHREYETGGSASRMRYHKGKIYYVSGGDGRLHCLDASSGKHLWVQKGPEFENNRDLFFDKAGLAIDSETDYLYVTDYRYAYCFKIQD